MLQILVSNQPISLGGYFTTPIISLDIQLLYPMQIHSHQTPQLKQWLNSIIDNLDCEYVSYQNVLIPSSELRRF